MGYCSGFMWLSVRSSAGHLWVMWIELRFYKVSTSLNTLFVIISNLTSSVYYRNFSTKQEFVLYFLFCIGIPIGAISVERTPISLKTGHRLHSHSTRNLSCFLFYSAWDITSHLAVAQQLLIYRTHEKYSTEHVESFEMNQWFSKYQTLWNE